MFIIVFTRARSRPCRGPDQANPRLLLPYFSESILILSFHLQAGFTSALFPAGFLTTTAYAPLLISPLSGNSSTQRVTYQGTTDILELTTSSVNILADQLIRITLFYTCQCASAIRSCSNLANNHERRGGDVQISTSLTPSEEITYNVKNASHTKHLYTVLSKTLKFVGNKTEFSVFKISDTRKESHSTRLNSIQRPEYWQYPRLSDWLGPGVA